MKITNSKVPLDRFERKYYRETACDHHHGLGQRMPCIQPAPRQITGYGRFILCDIAEAELHKKTHQGTLDAATKGKRR